MTERQLQLETKNKLHEEGWTFWFPPRTWGERDILGVFDLIAFRGKKMKLIQITTIQHISDRKKKILNWCTYNNVIPNSQFEVWGYNPKKGEFKIIKLSDGF